MFTDFSKNCISGPSLENLRLQSLSLKSTFSKTEKLSWTTSTIASELVLQMTHLAYSLLSEVERQQIFPANGVDKGLGDELSDVLFNCLNVLSFLDLTFFDIENHIREAKIIEYDKNVRTINGIIQAASVWDAIARLEGYKHLDSDSNETFERLKESIGAIIAFVFAIAEENDLDLNQEMIKMFLDAKVFLDSYK